MIATVFTDASFDHRTNAAGFAIWIKTSETTLRHAGPFKIAIKSASQAETAALANGIILASHRLDLKAGDTIVAASDCMSAIDVISGKQAPPGKAMRAVKELVSRTLQERGVALRLKHVKAHQGKDAGPRNAVNEWCDGEAKRAMRGQRAKQEKAA